jgi:hypothetical protein
MNKSTISASVGRSQVAKRESSTYKKDGLPLHPFLIGLLSFLLFLYFSEILCIRVKILLSILDLAKITSELTQHATHLPYKSSTVTSPHHYRISNTHHLGGNFPTVSLTFPFANPFIDQI